MLFLYRSIRIRRYSLLQESKKESSDEINITVRWTVDRVAFRFADFSCWEGVGLLVGISVTEPHTSELNCFIYLPIVCHPVQLGCFK